MKTSIKFAAGMILAAGALVASSTSAFAGSGGAAGSVSIQFAENATPSPAFPVSVYATGISSSIAIGKVSAGTAGSTNTNQETFTTALGTGGNLSLGGINAENATIGASIDGTVGTAQGNDLTNNGTIGGTGGVSSVTLP